ncbi:MAG: hypothetical protein M3N43_08345 [Actinomycetota bacterium]|nr:hypothetical protein [Actinomycetota bacterium]
MIAGWHRHAAVARPLVMDLDGAGERVPVDVCSCGAARKVGRWFWRNADRGTPPRADWRVA